MKRGISIHADHDREGERFLVVAKKKGKLTFDEIKDAVIEYGEEDYYAMILRCLDEDGSQYYDDDLPDDSVILYSADYFLRNKDLLRDVE